MSFPFLLCVFNNGDSGYGWEYVLLYKQFFVFFGPIQHIEGFSVLSNDTEMAGILKGTSRINPTP